jgi:uncharacterized protein (TIGR00725 family)
MKSIRYSIAVSGAVAGRTIEPNRQLAERLGRAIAKNNQLLVTGATVGLPYYVALAATEAGGLSIGFSPASSLREHLHKYRLPIGVFDFIDYTGASYMGRDVALVRSSDALITVGGRLGTLHEFITAIEFDMPCGILTGTGGTSDKINELLDTLEPPNRKQVVFDDDPERLVKTIIKMLDKEYHDIDIKDELARWYLDNPRPHHG